MSLIADSLKKAVKEKSFNLSPGINLLKNLGSKTRSSARFDSKEVRRFVILIVIPASILAYLLLANPLGHNKRQSSAPVVAKAPAPPVKPVPPPVLQNTVLQKNPAMSRYSNRE